MNQTVYEILQRIDKRIEANKMCLEIAEKNAGEESIKYFQSLIFEDRQIYSMIQEEYEGDQNEANTNQH